MLIKVFVLNKEKLSVAVHSSETYEFIQGSDLYMEPIDTAARRILDEAIHVQIGDELKLVRRESSTIVNKGQCRVVAIATFVYECGNIDISGTDYEWVVVGDVLSELCDLGIYQDAAYLNEACAVVQ